MDITLLLCGLAVGVLACTWVAERVDIPAPFLLIFVGVVASYVPMVPEVELSEDVVLFGLLPPLLYAAAQGTSLVDFRANRRAILLLSVGLVVFTTFGVGLVAHLLLPGVSWAIALAIGAVVAPPDAVAATAIGRRIGLPRRIVTILEGESLLNDATALVALGTALAVAEGSGFEPVDVGLDFLLAAGGGVVVGFVFFLVVAKLRRHLTDPVLDSGMSLVVPFAAYVAAEEVHASGVIAVVVAGLLLGHKAPILQTAQSRIAERLNWRTIAFVLENTVFLLIGLQARSIVEGAGESDLVVGPDHRDLRGHAGRLHRAAAGLGVPGALPHRPARPRPGDRPHAAVDLHVHAGLGRDAGRGHPRRGVRHPRGHAAPRGAAADGVHGRGRDAVHPGHVAAVAGPAAPGAGPRPGRGRAGPRHPAPAGVQGGAAPARRARLRRLARASSS